MADVIVLEDIVKQFTMGDNIASAATVNPSPQHADLCHQGVFPVAANPPHDEYSGCLTVPLPASIISTRKKWRG